MSRGLECEAHKHDAKVPQERHHVWPLGYHGPDTAANKVTICSNAHSDVHYLMEAWLRQKPVDVRDYGPGVRAIAKRGYDQVMAYGNALAAKVGTP